MPNNPSSTTPDVPPQICSSGLLEPLGGTFVGAVETGVKFCAICAGVAVIRVDGVALSVERPTVGKGVGVGLDASVEVGTGVKVGTTRVGVAVALANGVPSSVERLNVGKEVGDPLARVGNARGLSPTDLRHSLSSSSMLRPSTRRKMLS